MRSRTTKRPRLIIDVTPEIRRQVKARAALEDMTIREWVLGLITDELEEEEDSRIALERLKDLAGSVTLEELDRERSRMEPPSAL